MHTAPAHLESKLRFWDFTVGQIAAAFAGIMLGFVWAIGMHAESAFDSRRKAA